MMKIGYARVSTIDQNPQMQITALEKAQCETIFIEKKSGASKDRSELVQAIAQLKTGDTLIVWKLSRLARSLAQIIDIVKTLDAKGANLTVLSQNIDTRTPEGKLFFHITAAFDEFQRELIIENTRMGLIEAHRRGRKGGRPSFLTKSKKKHVEALIRDKINYPFISDIIKELGIGKATFYRHFPPAQLKLLGR